MFVVISLSPLYPLSLSPSLLFASLSLYASLSMLLHFPLHMPLPLSGVVKKWRKAGGCATRVGVVEAGVSPCMSDYVYKSFFLITRAFDGNRNTIVRAGKPFW